MIHSVKKIVGISPFSLRIKFETDEIKEVDMEHILESWAVSRGKEYMELLDPKYFIKAKVKNDTVSWKNGVDLCPDELYKAGLLID